MTLGSIILFFSFLVMLFSIHPPSVIVGLLVSVTLAGALFCDLFSHILCPSKIWLSHEAVNHTRKEAPVSTFRFNIS
jgi:hypothetical protein